MGTLQKNLARQRNFGGGKKQTVTEGRPQHGGENTEKSVVRRELQEKKNVGKAPWRNGVKPHEVVAWEKRKKRKAGVVKGGGNGK